MAEKQTQNSENRKVLKHFYINVDLIEKLQAYCKENDVPYSSVVRRATKQFLDLELKKEAIPAVISN